MDGKLIINDIEVRLTKHARHRAKNRKITLDEIKEAILNFKSKRRSQNDDGSFCYIYNGKNKVVVIANEELTLVITVMRLSKAFSKSKAKYIKNKNKVKNKRLFGNRARH